MDIETRLRDAEEKINTATSIGHIFGIIAQALIELDDYDLKGKVVVVEKDKHLLTVAHEDIKDYMPGMTMPFTVGETSDWVFQPPHEVGPGDQITATLIVDGAKSWLEDIVLTKETSDTTSVGAEGVGPKAGDEVPDYRLTNQDGKVIRIHDYKGKALLLTFIYTRCPDPNQCTLMSSNFANIDQELQKQPDLYQKTHLLSISFDTEYDTPKCCAATAPRTPADIRMRLSHIGSLLLEVRTK